MISIYLPLYTEWLLTKVPLFSYLIRVYLLQKISLRKDCVKMNSNISQLVKWVNGVPVLIEKNFGFYLHKHVVASCLNILLDVLSSKINDTAEMDEQILPVTFNRFNIGLPLTLYAEALKNFALNLCEFTLLIGLAWMIINSYYFIYLNCTVWLIKW